MGLYSGGLLVGRIFASEIREGAHCHRENEEKFLDFLVFALIVVM